VLLNIIFESGLFNPLYEIIFENVKGFSHVRPTHDHKNQDGVCNHQEPHHLDAGAGAQPVAEALIVVIAHISGIQPVASIPAILASLVLVASAFPHDASSCEDHLQVLILERRRGTRPSADKDPFRRQFLEFAIHRTIPNNRSAELRRLAERRVEGVTVACRSPRNIRSHQSSHRLAADLRRDLDNRFYLALFRSEDAQEN